MEDSIFKWYALGIFNSIHKVFEAYTYIFIYKTNKQHPDFISYTLNVELWDYGIRW